MMMTINNTPAERPAGIDPIVAPPVRYAVESWGKVIKTGYTVQECVQFIRDNWVDGEGFFVEIVDRYNNFTVAQFFDDDEESMGVRVM